MQIYAVWIQIALSIILRLKTFTEEIANDIKKIFDTSNYEINRPLHIGKKQKSD